MVDDVDEKTAAKLWQLKDRRERRATYFYR
jgi:hypothetical protein